MCSSNNSVCHKMEVGMVSTFKQTELTFNRSEIQNSLYSEIFYKNVQEVKNILSNSLNSDIQKVFRNQFLSGRTIFDVAKLIQNEEIIQELQQKASEYTNALWNECKKTQDSLRFAVVNSNLRDVKSILEKSNSEENKGYTQKVLRSKFNGGYTILDIAVMEQEEDIIKELWQEANEDTRVLLSDSAIKWARCGTEFDAKKFISEIENYERAINDYRKSYKITKNFEEWPEDFIQKVKDYMKQKENPAEKLEDVRCCEIYPSCRCSSTQVSARFQ